LIESNVLPLHQTGNRTDIVIDDIALSLVGHADVSWRNGWTDRAAVRYTCWQLL